MYYVSHEPGWSHTSNHIPVQSCYNTLVTLVVCVTIGCGILDELYGGEEGYMEK